MVEARHKSVDCLSAEEVTSFIVVAPHQTRLPSRL